MRRVFIFLLAFVVVGAWMGLSVHRASAVSAFNQNNIIDDAKFDQVTSMNQTDIQNFLNAHSPCLKNYQAPEPIDYFNYGANAPASRIIYDAAQAWGLNPQVILTTLDKEESLLTGASCDDWRYNSAMGMGCPDSGPCPAPAYAGFSKQVMKGSWQLKFNKERANGNTAWDDDGSVFYSGYMTQGNRARTAGGSVAFYDGYATIDSTQVHMDDAATASLYTYTPHFHGNQSFLTIFETWFGSVRAAEYAWTPVGASYSPDMIGGTKETVTITARNDGYQSWSNTNFPVRLATFSPTNHASALYDSTWVTPYRLATLNQASVAPGDTGSFTFTIDAPFGRSGSYDEHFNLVVEGYTWMNDPGFTLHLNLTPPTLSYRMVSQASSAGWSLNSGTTSTITFVAQNTGNVTWSNSTNPVRLATWVPSYRQSAFYDSSWISQVRTVTMQEASVAPGANGTFVFTIHAPPQSGSYVERFNLVMEGAGWFQDPWLEFDINVLPTTYSYHMVSQTSSGGWSIGAGAQSILTLTVQNTGNTTWSNTTNPVRLATWNPPYRSSAFFDSSWISQVRVVTMQQPTVSPGQNATFQFTVTAPQKTGFYAERFNLVMEGVAWFQDPWLEFDINVH